jgi:hypothetical protein
VSGYNAGMEGNPRHQSYRNWAPIVVPVAILYCFGGTVAADLAKRYVPDLPGCYAPLGYAMRNPIQFGLYSLLTWIADALALPDGSPVIIVRLSAVLLGVVVLGFSAVTALVFLYREVIRGK